MTKTTNFPHIGQALEIGLYVKQSADYTMFEMERMTRAVSENTFKDICQQVYTKTTGEVIPMGNGKKC